MSEQFRFSTKDESTGLVLDLTVKWDRSEELHIHKTNGDPLSDTEVATILKVWRKAE